MVHMNFSLVLWVHPINSLLQGLRSIILDLHQCITKTDDNLSLWTESFAIINLCGVSTKFKTDKNEPC